MTRQLAAPSRLRVLAASLAAACAVLAGPAAAAGGVNAERVWQYAHAPANAGQKSEIVAYDKRSDTLWVAGVVGVDVLDRQTGALLAHVPVSHLGAVNSVAIHDGLAALAIEASPDRTLPGKVVLFDTKRRTQIGQPITVGALPDMLTFTPDGKQIVVANEGTPNTRPTPAGLSDADPQGSVSIIDLKRRRVTTLPLLPSLPGYDQLRLFPSTMSSYDPEPEYIAVDKRGERAYVTLQEANGIAVVDLRRLRIEKIIGLGLTDFNLPGNEIDPNDKDGEIRLRNVPVKGLYQPDSIASYEHAGRTYLVMANEGDSRDNGDEDSEDEVRGYDKDAAVPLVAKDSELARLTMSNIDASPDGQLVAFGGHSFSIRDTAGRIVFDSGSELDRETIRLGIYDDGRSDNKGVEPEGVALATVKGRTLAFIGLERTTTSAVAVYDVTNPRKARLLDTLVGEGDLAPEGLKAFSVGRRLYLAVANESSDTTSLWRLRGLDCDETDDADER